MEEPRGRGREREEEKGAPAWVCRRVTTDTTPPPATWQPSPLPLVILNSAPCNPRATLSTESRSQSPTTAPSHCLLATGPEISQTFLRLNGLKRHTPAHLRAPVRVLSLSLPSLRLFQVRFPFLSPERG